MPAYDAGMRGTGGGGVARVSIPGSYTCAALSPAPACEETVFGAPLALYSARLFASGVTPARTRIAAGAGFFSLVDSLSPLGVVGRRPSSSFRRELLANIPAIPPKRLACFAGVATCSPLVPVGGGMLAGDAGREEDGEAVVMGRNAGGRFEKNE